MAPPRQWTWPKPGKATRAMCGAANLVLDELIELIESTKETIKACLPEIQNVG